MRRIACSICLALILVVGATGEVAAENLKGRWSVGGGFSWLSVKDDIRNNASFILFDQPAQFLA